nr:hypothetical protein [Deinococcus aestuarii]
MRYAQGRAEKVSRTQQLELDPNLFIRIAPGGRRFLLFCLEGEPDHATARAVAEALGLKDPRYGWHQGATLRSLTVVEEGADPGPDLNSHLSPEADGEMS